MATKTALKRSTASNVPASDRKVGKADNQPDDAFTIETFEATIIELGNAARTAKDDLNKAEGAVKKTAADGMIAFTKAAEQGILTASNFEHAFGLWCFGKVGGKTSIVHASEKSRFSKAMLAGILAMQQGISFVPVIEQVQKTANEMIAARRAVTGDARKALPEARQADLAVYNVLNRMGEKAEKAGNKGGMALLNADELQAAIEKKPSTKKTATEQSAAERLQSMIDTINTMSKDAPKALRETYRSARNALEDLVASLEPAETEEESETEDA